MDTVSRCQVVISGRLCEYKSIKGYTTVTTKIVASVKGNRVCIKIFNFFLPTGSALYLGSFKFVRVCW
jgi:hypothetical protein